MKTPRASLVALILAGACGGAPVPAAAPSPVANPDPMAAVVAPRTAADDAVGGAGAGKPMAERRIGAADGGAAPGPTMGIPASGARTRYPSPLPPAKPTTIPLASPSSTAPGDVELVAGDQALERGDWKEAARQYEAARALAPKAAAPLVGVARVRIARADLPLDYGSSKGNGVVLGAVGELRRAAKAEPDFGPAQVELGRALLLLGEGDGALDALRRGSSLCPDQAEAQSAFGVALLATGKGEDAVTALAQAAQLDPGSAARHGNLGTVLLMRGKVAEAIDEYELQSALADGDPMAHADLGTALLAKGDVARASTELERAVRMEPRRATFHSNLGYALQLQGKNAEAIAHYREAIRLDDRMASAWINLGTALAKDGKTRSEARAAFVRARKIDPADPRVKANLEELDALERGAPATTTTTAKPAP